MTKAADLTTYIFAGTSSSALARELRQWMEASTRFTEFVETYRDKIRKKVRTAGSAEGMLDLRAELVVARGLLDDRRFAVAYEPYASAKRRGPDFSVTYRANTIFNIEVAHIRAEEGEVDIAKKEERVLRILLDKLGQMQPGMPNLLAINTRAEVAQAIDLDGLLQALKRVVDSKDPAFFAATHYASPTDFYKGFLLLSGILFWSPGGQLWVNKQAKPALDEKVIRLVSAAAVG